MIMLSKGNRFQQILSQHVLGLYLILLVCTYGQ